MEPVDRDWLEDRVRGCLGLAALGDAAGAPFEEWSRAEVTAYGDPLRAIRDGAGAVTDDTGQLEALARALVNGGGELSEEAWREALVEWFRESPTAAKAGPTTRAMLEGRPVEPDDRIGVTNGAAMRAAPCGLVRPGDPDAAAELAWVASRPTHDTEVAGAAAAAVAAGVAVALRPGATLDELLDACVRGADRAVPGARRTPHPSVARRIELAIETARAASDPGEALEQIEAAVGTSMLAHESVPAAIGALTAARGQPLEAVRTAIGLGGDTDTVAAIAGALAGALHGHAALGPGDRALAEPLLAAGLEPLVAPLAAIADERSGS